MDKGVVIEEGSPQKYLSPDSERVKQFLQYFSE